MSTWTMGELQRVSAAVELRVEPRRADGTLSPYVTIWHVGVGDAVYIRSAHGPTNDWFRRAQEAGLGRTSAGGVERDVAFEPASPDVREAVDAAYHAKYDRYGAGPVGAVTGPDVLDTTLRVVPDD